MDQDATWYGGRAVGLGQGDFVSHGDPAPPTQKGGTVPNIRPMSIVAKRSPISATAELLFLFDVTIPNLNVLILPINLPVKSH